MTEYAYEYEVFSGGGRFIAAAFDFDIAVIGGSRIEAMRLMTASLHAEVARRLTNGEKVPVVTHGNKTSHGEGRALVARFDVSTEAGYVDAGHGEEKAVGASGARVPRMAVDGKAKAETGEIPSFANRGTVAAGMHDGLAYKGSRKSCDAELSTGELPTSLGLLEILQYRAGCMYLSDLHSPSNIPFVRHAVSELDAESFEIGEWNDAVAYITGECLRFDRPSDAADYLAGRISMNCEKEKQS